MSWKEFRNCPILPSSGAKTCSHQAKVRKRRALLLAQQSPVSTTLTSSSKQGKKALRPAAARRFFKDRRAAHAPTRQAPLSHVLEPSKASAELIPSPTPPSLATDSSRPKGASKRPASPQRCASTERALRGISVSALSDIPCEAEGYQSEHRGTSLSRPRQSRQLH